MNSSSPFVGLLKIGLKWVSKLLLILSLLASSLFLTNYTTHIDNGCFKLFLRVKRLYKNTKKKKEKSCEQLKYVLGFKSYYKST